MDRFVVKRKQSNVASSSSNSIPARIDLDNLPWDPFERKPISSYHPNQKDEIRRAYLLRGPCQPIGHEFPQRDFSGKSRRFRPEWFQQYGNWLEYSVKTDRAYCLFCYLFKEIGQKDAFVNEGFNGWNKTERFTIHIGDANSIHNKARRKGEDLLKQEQSIHVAFEKQSDKQKREYRIRLSSSVLLAKALLNGGLSFRAHDESETSLYRGHFIEFLKVFGQLNEEIGKVILGNAPGNSQMTSPLIQKEICNCFAQEVLKQVFKELDDDVFAILVDESRDVSKKEQMAVVLRFVDKLGLVKERFIGLVHVMETTSLSLKSAIDELFARYKFDNFNTVLDMQIQELSNRFNEVTTELLTCMSSLSPSNNFCYFDTKKILRLAEMYPHDFDYEEKDKLKYELGIYIRSIKEDTRFADINDISALVKKMVETRRHIDYPLVYRMLKLSLVLPVATASVERCFSSMKHVKTDLRNRMGDEYMNDSCICYIEKELFAKVSIEDVMERFQKMKTRREQL